MDNKIQFLSIHSGLFRIQRTMEHICKNGVVSEAINFYRVKDYSCMVPWDSTDVWFCGIKQGIQIAINVPVMWWQGRYRAAGDVEGDAVLESRNTALFNILQMTKLHSFGLQVF